MPSTSLATLRTATYSKLDDNTLFYPESEVDWGINEAIRLLNLMCGWLTKTSQIYNGGTTVADRCIYRVPDDIAIPQKVVLNGSELDKVGLFQLFRAWPDWMQDTTASTGQPVARWSPYALNRFILHPADSDGGAVVEVTGIENVTPLVNAADTVSIPKSGVVTVSDYAAHIVQCKLGSVPLTQSMPMYRSYDQMVRQNNIWRNYRQPNFWLDNRDPE